ncbi:hypothetical protein Dimus_009211 [Dionaea muscipula]
MLKQEAQQRPGRGVAVVPVGRRYQAVLPSCKKADNDDDDDDDSSCCSRRWLGTRTWPLEDVVVPEFSGETGSGRCDSSCQCADPGSFSCKRLHTVEEQERLRSELGPAYESWHFDEMGEQVSRSWTREQQNKFEIIVRQNPPSRDKSFVQPAMESFSKTRDEVVSYFLNVYLPGKFSKGEMVDTDDEASTATRRGGSGGSSSSSSSCAKTKSSKPSQSPFLVGRR